MKTKNETVVSDVLGHTNIHLDFHNPAFQKEVGADFNGEDFALRLKDSNVDSITFFANCYHGFSYYKTEKFIEHPGLKRDLLREVVEC